MAVSKKSLFALALPLLVAGFQASAAVVTLSDRATFNAEGSILHNSNFDDFSGQFSFPGTPFTRGDVTYHSAENLIVGDCSYSVGCARQVMSNNYWSPLTGTVLSDTQQYTLFGFDLAVTSGFVNLTITTNADTYYYPELMLPDGAPDFSFQGFKATGGEYFTGFRVDTQGGGYLPGMTDVALGRAGRGPSAQSTPVPEPAGLALVGLALVGLATTRRAQLRK